MRVTGHSEYQVRTLTAKNNITARMTMNRRKKGVATDNRKYRVNQISQTLHNAKQYIKTKHSISKIKYQIWNNLILEIFTRNWQSFSWSFPASFLARKINDIFKRKPLKPFVGHLKPVQLHNIMSTATEMRLQLHFPHPLLHTRPNDKPVSLKIIKVRQNKFRHSEVGC
jgi:hypothetical protein